MTSPVAANWTGKADHYEWFEVWVDDTARPPYLLILSGHRDGKVFDIYDPLVEIVRHSASTYQDVMFWLTEDEYTKVDGRMMLD